MVVVCKISPLLESVLEPSAFDCHVNNFIMMRNNLKRSKSLVGPRHFYGEKNFFGAGYAQSDFLKDFVGGSQSIIVT